MIYNEVNPHYNKNTLYKEIDTRKTSSIVQSRFDGFWNSFIFQPYLDLSPSVIGPLHTQGIDLAFNLIDKSESDPIWTQHVLTPSFRLSLIHETGLCCYDIKSPIELNPHLRTDRWNYLVELIRNWKSLDDEIKSRIAKLLSKLGLFEAILALIPKITIEQISSSDALARMSFIRASADYMLHLHNLRYKNINDFSPNAFISIALNAPPSSRTRFAVALKIMVIVGKAYGSLEIIKIFKKIAFDTLNLLKSYVSDFEYNLLLSAFYRASSFIPFLNKDKQNLFDEMNMAESIARTISRNNETKKLLVDENLYTVLQSRAKEALFFNEIELAEERLLESLKVNPYDVKPYLELGKIYLMQNKYDEALEYYEHAIYLGPPGTALAWFMAGRCHEKKNNRTAAINYYLQSLKINDKGFSPLIRLISLSKDKGNDALYFWTKLRLNDLLDKGLITERDIIGIKEILN